MKNTEFGSSEVRNAAMSAFRSSAGAAVWTSGAPSSAAMMCASDVLPSPGGPRQQHVVERLAAAAGRLDEDRELVRDRVLRHEVRQRRRPQRAVEVVVGIGGAHVDHPRNHAVGQLALEARVARDRHAPAAARSAAPIRSSGVSPSAAVEQPLGLDAACSRG